MQIPSNCHVKTLIITELESTSAFPLTPSVHCTFLCTRRQAKVFLVKILSLALHPNKWLLMNGGKTQTTLRCHCLTLKIHTFEKRFLSPCCLTLDKSLNLFVPQFPICKMGIIMLTTMDKALVKY